MIVPAKCFSAQSCSGSGAGGLGKRPPLAARVEVVDNARMERMWVAERIVRDCEVAVVIGWSRIIRKESQSVQEMSDYRQRLGKLTEFVESCCLCPARRRFRTLDAKSQGLSRSSGDLQTRAGCVISTQFARSYALEPLWISFDRLLGGRW